MSHRPMPGPPEYWWYCTPPHGEPGLWTSDMDPAEYMPFTHLQHKRLTDAECAAEFWRAEGDHCLASEGYDIDWFSGDLLRDEDIACDVHATWHRFATRPHAFDAT